jgi:PPP family 3-phenylpropionic acid transporter
MRPPPSPPLGFVPRLAGLYIGLFLFSGVQQPFFPVWLKAKGLDPSWIGLAVALPSLVRVFGIAFAAREADRRDALRQALAICACLSVAAYALVGASSGALVVFMTYLMASLVYAPLMPLTDTYALKGLWARGRAYGPVRLWGSIAFIAGNFVAGAALDLMPAQHLIWIMVAATAVTASAALTLAPVSAAAPEAQAPRVARTGLLRDRGFIAVLAAASLIQASHAVYYGFSALQWRGDGLDGRSIGALWAIGVFAEIVLFAFQARLSISSTGLLMIGAAGALARWGVMMLNPPAALLPFLQILHALSFGATHLGALTYVARHAGEGQAATAQGHLAIALSAVMAVTSAVSGPLYAQYGVASYAAMALMAVAGGVAARIAGRAGAITDMPRG